LHRSVKETRRSVATRPNVSMSTLSCYVSDHVAPLDGRAGGIAGTVDVVLGILRQRRWIGFTLLTLTFLLLFIRLGIWQLSRLHERRSSNAIISANLAAPPASYPDIVAGAAGAAVPVVTTALEWRQVEITGRWDAAHQVLLRNRTFESVDGYEVITPLQPASGPALLVDRGWVEQGSTSQAPKTNPVPQGGLVTVIAWLRPSWPAHPSSGLPAGQVLAIDAHSIGQQLPYPILDGYAILEKEDPAIAGSPTLLPGPVVDDGPHLSYAVQWFLFGGVAIVGWWIFVSREADEATEGVPDRKTQLPDSVRMG
jgi:cytochrome oxidase assembly protein ShyY1